MSTLEISKFSLREKVRIMQAIWQDLQSHVDRLEVPQSHKDLLNARRARVQAGKAAVLDWDQVKHTIGRR